MRTSLLLALFLVVGCSTSERVPTQPNPPDSLFKAQSFFDVVDRRVWLEEGDLPMRSQVRAEVLRIQSENTYGATDFTRFLPEIVGADREFTLIPLTGGKKARSQNVKIRSAKFIAIEIGDESDRQKHFKECTAYPLESLVITLESEGRKQLKMNGYLFPLGTILFTDPAKELPEVYQTYRKDHAEFVSASYGDLFPNYEKLIDAESFAVRTPGSMLYFFGPNPPVADRSTYRAYRFDEKLKTFSAIILTTRMTCTK